MTVRRGTTRKSTVERAALLTLTTRATRAVDPETSLDELAGLAQAAGAEVVLRAMQERPTPDAATVFGKGKAEEIALACRTAEVDVVIIDHHLSPAQARNLERVFGCRVIDRTELILDIFALRARTREGKLQVELAQLQYMLPRLVGSSEALSRLGGGIGTRGPGETKLETDRRRIRHRIAALKREIADVSGRRGYLRARRRRGDVPTVALVGYTNAGKTTLFNVLTGDNAVASDALFVTLDPLVRRVRLPDARHIMMADTVGFIDRLPHSLVAAFRATLEEVIDADLLLHVVDASAEDRERRDKAVRDVLTEIGAGAVPMLEVYNKCDRLDPRDRDRLAASSTNAVCVSATEQQGIRELLDLVTSRLAMDTEAAVFELDYGNARDRQFLADVHRHGQVTSQVSVGDRVTVHADVPRRWLEKTGRALLGVILVVGGMVGCATGTPATRPAAPRFVDVPVLVVPAPLAAAAEARARHDAGWLRFQAGDLRAATREFQAALVASPGFYPSEAGLGYVAFYDKRWDEAAKWFDAALSRDGAYVPALSGRVETALSAGDDRAAIRALELWVKVAADGAEREELRGRLDVLRLRAVQAELAQAANAREAGRLDDAQAALNRAREMSPDSAVVLRELARVEAARGAFDEAETHARRAVTLDPGDGDAHAVLGEVLEAHGRLRDAAAAFTRAANIDPRPEWRSRAAALSSRAEFDALPAEFRAIPSAQSITRGQLAALLGSRLQAAIERAPRRVTVVLTDVRSHWAAAWILPVTRAGVMDPLPNHTFQPGAIVRRSDLAQIVWQAIQVLGAHRPGEVSRWRTARVSVDDVPATHLAFAAITAAVASGAMSLVDDTRFLPGRPVSGPEAIAAVARLEQIAQGGGR